MANAQYKIERIVFDFTNDSFTLVEVWCGAPSDGMLGVQGCHKKAFSKDIAAIDIIRDDIAKQEYLTW